MLVVFLKGIRIKSTGNALPDIETVVKIALRAYPEIFLIIPREKDMKTFRAFMPQPVGYGHLPLFRRLQDRIFSIAMP